MLDRTETEYAFVGVTEVEALGLSKTERSLISRYRLLSEQEQLQLRRLFDVLTSNPEEQVITQ